MKLMHYSLIFALAVAPLVADDRSQSTATVQQEEVQYQNDSNQSKSISERCWEYRYYIAGGALLLATAAFTAYLYNGLNNLPMKSVTLFADPVEPTNLELSQENLSQKNTEFGYPAGYSDLSKQRVDELKKAHKIFDKICGGKCKWTYSCDQAVQALEEMHRTGKDTRHLIAAIAERGTESIVDPIERLNAEKAIEQAVAKLCPVAAQVNS